MKLTEQYKQTGKITEGRRSRAIKMANGMQSTLNNFSKNLDRLGKTLGDDKAIMPTARALEALEDQFSSLAIEAEELED